MKIASLYETVTAKIIADMEAGVCVWTRPWRSPKHHHGSIMPHNRATQRGYSGINVPILWCEADEKGYPTAEWLTYRQALALGAQVRKGETATPIVFTRQLTKIENEEEKKFGILRNYYVFNAAQIDELPPLTPPQQLIEPERHAQAEAFLSATNAKVITAVTVPAISAHRTT